MNVPPDLVENPPTPLAVDVFSIIRRDPRVSIQRLAMRLGVSVQTVATTLLVLEAAGWIRRRGRGGSTSRSYSFPRDTRVA